ncbi:uncharacterized protein RHIMIDRAFT_255680, partial [Rhizopus microsporus ATCC 52813]
DTFGVFHILIINIGSMVCFRAASSNGVLCFVWSAFVPHRVESTNSKACFRAASV